MSPSGLTARGQVWTRRRLDGIRFARVVRYRDDKSADEADTIETVRSLGGR